MIYTLELMKPSLVAVQWELLEKRIDLDSEPDVFFFSRFV